MEQLNNQSADSKLVSSSRPASSSKSNSYAAEVMLPSHSPSRKRISRVSYGDRFIPNRTGIDLPTAFSLTNHDFGSSQWKKLPENELDYKREQEADATFSTVLKAELFGDSAPNATPPAHISGVMKSRSSETRGFGRHGLTVNTSPPRSSRESYGHNAMNSSSANINNNLPSSANHDSYSSYSMSSMIDSMRGSPKTGSNILTYKSPRKTKSTTTLNVDINNEMYSVSPVRTDSQRLLLLPQKKSRQISKVPYRVLDAPDLADDFYLNLVDWGCQNILAVGLGSSVYLWDAVTGSVDRLCDLGDNNKITSLSWIGAGTHLAVGTNLGLVEIWDASSCKCTRTMTGHISRVGSLAWNEHILTSGSRDRSILNRDVRVPEHFISKLENFHKQEICGLRWNVEENKLASGGNDNKLIVWDGFNTSKPLYKFEEHTAAIKAISWCPHQRGVLASGGGTADRKIKMWSTLTGSKINDVDTGSQVCNLLWSKNSNELVSTHGYSKNQIVIWKNTHNPSSVNGQTNTETNSQCHLQQIASLTGHTYRVLYLAMSPDGETIVTGAGDETLRFWKVFEKSKSDNQNSILLDAFMQLR